MKYLTSLAGLLLSMSVVANTQNVLLIIADDLGTDYLASYGRGADYAPTPNIDRLAATGVQFENAWANPVCSPTRAGMLTGRYGFRTGVTTVVGGRTGGSGIGLDEFSLPDAVEVAQPERGHAAIGKWHLSDSQNGDELNPNLMGFDFFSGLLAGQSDYFTWEKTVNGTTQTVNNYATTENVDDAISWIAAQDGPWFTWLAFTNPHTPFHLPPAELHGFDDLSGSRRDLRNNPIPYFKAMVEAMDTEIGRLLDYLETSSQLLDTHVIFIGDNGTTSEVVQPPFDPDRAKTTLYEGGINVPLIVSGPGLINPGRQSEALVNSVDIYATALELMGIDAGSVTPSLVNLDSISFAPVLRDQTTGDRNWIYSELAGQDENLGGQTIRNQRYKLIRFADGREALYNLESDSRENNNLLLSPLSAVAERNYERLASQLADLEVP